MLISSSCNILKRSERPFVKQIAVAFWRIRIWTKRDFFWLHALVVVTLIPLLNSCNAPVPIVTSCKTDLEVPTNDLASINRVATKFVEDTLGPTPSAAYTTLTADTKAGISVEEFVSGFQGPIRARGPLTNVHVAHTYLAEARGGIQEQRVVCGDLSRPEAWVTVAAKPGITEADVIVEGEAVNNTHAVVLRLRPDAENWRVQSVHLATVGMARKSAEDLWRIAEAEHQKQHSFNALIFYTAAMQLADRGPFLQLGVHAEIEKGMSHVAKPPILEGSLPFSWTFGDSTFKVTNVGPIGVAGKIYLVVDHQIEPWSEDNLADRKNRDLIAALNKAVEEYKEAFAGIVVRAHERGGNRGFGTVHENDK